jgi:SAM-dependent methyltransferase
MVGSADQPVPSPAAGMSWDRLPASYDHVAARYEEEFRNELVAKPRDRELLAAFAATGDPVVEVGSGPGQVGEFVRQHGRRVIGLDLSLAMTRLAAGRLESAVAADMRQLPFGSGRLGGLLAFYSVIHLLRSQLLPTCREFHRVLRPGGRLLLSAHEGQGEKEVGEFLGEPVPFVATLFSLSELTGAASASGLSVIMAERRDPYETESPTVRLYIEAVRPT